MMYMVYNKDYIHHVMNECKMLIFAYNNDRRVYDHFTSAQILQSETYLTFF